MDKNISDILAKDERREADMLAPFNPITGENSILERKQLAISDFPIPVQWVPEGMMEVELVKQVAKAGSVARWVETECPTNREETNAEMVKSAMDELVRIRIRYDFCFWAALLVWIHPKGGGDDVHFVLNRPQRKLIEIYERYRIAGMPIRIILLKARQWGGSTATQMYFAWLQLVHKTGLNSLIVSHVLPSSYAILNMFKNMLEKYPLEFLYEVGENYDERETKWAGVGASPSTHMIPQRNCVIKVGTAEKPDNDRSFDYNLIHLSEVGLWKKTEGRSPEELVQGATSGVLLRPYTMIVIESTAKGTGNYFHREYVAAKEGKSQFKPLFIAWFEIEQYRLPFKTEDEKSDFAVWLWENRDNRNTMSDREEPGWYLWWLWEKGASLEAIHWYIEERKKFTDHGRMASEYPSDDVEAFAHSGAKVFDAYYVDKFRKACRTPLVVGDVYGKEDEGADALKDLKFKEDHQGQLWIWEQPEKDDGDEIVTERYITSVDIGGRSNKADWSVICVFDRYWMMEGDKPVVVAQWYGHCDIDLLAWKAAQIAAYYNNSLLVIESNTLETHDKDRYVEGDQSTFVLNQIKDVYPNLYARKQSYDDIREGKPVNYGFHTNVSTKPMLISTLVKIVREGMYVERDQRCLDEYLTYERKDNGAYGAIVGRHDDLLMSRAIGLRVCFYEMDTPQIRRKSHLKELAKGRRVVSEATIG